MAPSDEEVVRRHSVAADAPLVTDDALKAEKEAANGLLQFDLGVKMIEEGIERGDSYRLRPSAILALHRAALEGLSLHAGSWRPAGVEIGGSLHRPIGAHLVPSAIEEMCDYVNDNWSATSALHLSAYVMWRLNWIHPFSDGNGRTSRITSYLVLCVRTGYRLPGTHTIPDQIVENRKPYFAALEAADQAMKEGRIDVSAMEALIGTLLANQLLKVFELAGGGSKLD